MKNLLGLSRSVKRGTNLNGVLIHGASGKSSIAMTLAVDLAEAGESVLFVCDKAKIEREGGFPVPVLARGGPDIDEGKGAEKDDPSCVQKEGEGSGAVFNYKECSLPELWAAHAKNKRQADLAMDLDQNTNTSNQGDAKWPLSALSLVDMKYVSSVDDLVHLLSSLHLYPDPPTVLVFDDFSSMLSSSMSMSNGQVGKESVGTGGAVGGGRFPSHGSGGASSLQMQMQMNVQMNMQMSLVKVSALINDVVRSMKANALARTRVTNVSYRGISKISTIVTSDSKSNIVKAKEMTLVFTDNSSDPAYIELLRKRMNIYTDVYISPRKAFASAAFETTTEVGPTATATSSWSCDVKVRRTVSENGMCDQLTNGNQGTHGNQEPRDTHTHKRRRKEMNYSRTVSYDKGTESRMVLRRDPNKDGVLYLTQTGPALYKSI